MIFKHINYRFYRIAVLALALMLFMPAISIAARVTLEWSQNAVSENVDGYTVYYGLSSRHDKNSEHYGGYEWKREFDNQTTGTIPYLQSGQQYYFAVTAHNTEDRESDFSDEIGYYVPQPTFDTYYEENTVYGTDPNNVDTDSDGLTDYEEETFYGTDPNNVDTDGDGITDGNEVESWGDNWNNDYDGDEIVNLLDPDSDNDGLLDGIELAYDLNPFDSNTRLLFPVMETGEVSIDHEWRRIEFGKCFIDPVVVAKSLSYNGSQSAIIRIQNVDNTGFDIRIQEWDYLDGYHVFETVGYIIMERGSYTLEDGTMVEAGSFTTNNTSSFKTVNYKNSFNKFPVVTAAVVSYNDNSAVLCRTINHGTDGFAFCLQEQELNSQIHATEEVAYIAWEPSRGILNSVAFEINFKFLRNDYSQEISFNQTFINLPVFISDIQTGFGTDPANLRWENKDEQGVYIKIVEEQSYDLETYHPAEIVGFMAFSVQ